MSIVEEDSAFYQQRQNEIKRMVLALLQSGYIDKETLKGTGIDLGAWVGTAGTVLKQFGATVTSVDQSSVQLEKGVSLGFIPNQSFQVGDATKVLQNFPAASVDFVTFFGAQDKAADVLGITSQASRILNPWGFLLVTGLSDLREDIHFTTQRYGGTVFGHLSQNYWDSIGYLYQQP